jgi:hypothetical protein
MGDANVPIHPERALKIPRQFGPRMRGALLEHAGDQGGLDRHDAHVGRRGHVPDGRVRGDPLHRGPVGVHRVDLAPKRRRLHIAERPPADPVRVVRRPDDRDRARIDQRIQAGEVGMIQ